jgi:hypothetical protein
MDPISAATCFPHDSCRLDDSEDPPQPDKRTADATPQRSDGCVPIDTPGPDGCPTWVCADSYDFDAHIQATVVSPELFSRNSAGDVDEISPGDVHQGQMGDCALMATLSALASTPQGRALIRSAIVENRDAQGHVVSYSVTLHDRRPTPLGSALSNARYLNRELGNQAVDAYHTSSKVTVTVNGTYVCGHAIAQASDNGTNEVWPLVLEKAIAQVLGGYGAMSRGSLSHRSMEMLTGKPASCHDIWGAGSPMRILPGSFVPNDVAAAVAAGKLVVLNTPKTLALPGQSPPYGLETRHAYWVSGIVTVNGTQCAVLHNPWGFADPQPVPVDKLADCFCTVCVGSVN